MAEAAAYSGPDGIRFWTDKNAGFAHLALHTTPEAPLEQQPLRDPQTGTIWVADARVDNRDELIDLFTKCGEIRGQGVVTDVELLMLAYRKWGEDFLPNIYGNYAFVMWDPNRQRALAGRDFLGLRPMFYMRHGQTMYFASAIRSILAVLPGRPALNELLIADYYRYNFDRWIAETIYLPIRRLPAACQVSVDARDETIHQHWMITNAPILRYKNERDYYDEFLELFQTAIKACARANTPLGVELSGGIDSSSITCMLHKLWKDGCFNNMPPSINLYTTNLAHELSEDESYFSAAVIRSCPEFSSKIISGEKFWGFQEVGNEKGYHLDEPDHNITRSLAVARLQLARQDGCKVMLKGIGGDELFQFYCDEFDILRGLPFSFWGETMWNYYLHSGFPGIIKFVARTFRNVRWVQPLRRKLQGAVLPPWVHRDPVRQLNSVQPSFKLAVPERFSSVLQRIKPTLIFTSGFNLRLLEYSHQHAVEANAENRYPFLDRRLVEFVFRLPTKILLDYKFLLKPFLKVSLSGVIPQEIISRTNKTGINPMLNMGLRNKERLKIQNLLNQVQQHQSEFIDFYEYNKAWNTFFTKKDYSHRVLYSPLLLQVWINDNKNVWNIASNI